MKNCVLMQDTVVEAGAELDHVVTDKNVTITEGKNSPATASRYTWARATRYNQVVYQRVGDRKDPALCPLGE